MWNIANMYGAGQLGKEDFLMACVWSYRARTFAGPADRNVVMQVARVMPQLESKLSAEQLASCHEQGNSWNPQKSSPKTNGDAGKQVVVPSSNGRK